MNKRLSLLLIIVLALSSLTLISHAHASETVAKLPAPRFSVQYADESYDVSESTSVDPYSGKNVTNPGYHVVKKALLFIVEVQSLSTSDFIHFYIRMKGHFSENWTYVCYTRTGFNFFTFSSSGNGWFKNSGGSCVWSNFFYAPDGGQVDFQAQAITRGFTFSEEYPGDPFGGWDERTTGESDWSNQTIALPAPILATPLSGEFASDSSKPAATPDVGTQQIAQPFPTLQAIVVSAIIVAASALGILVYVKNLKCAAKPSHQPLGHKLS